MNRWIPLNQIEQLTEIQSNPGLTLIFKHSTQCPVSSMAKKSFEWDLDKIPSEVSLYFLDLIRFRNISNAIAEKWNVLHESPQVILIEAGKAIFHESHAEISAIKIGELANNLAS